MLSALLLLSGFSAFLAAEQESQLVTDRLRLAAVYLENGLYQQALALVEDVLLTDSKNNKAAELLRQIFAVMESEEPQIDPDLTTTLLNMLAEAEKHYHSGNHDQAIAIIKESLILNDEFAPSYALLAEINVDDNPARAADYAHTAIGFNAELWQPYYLLGKIAYESGELQESLMWLTHAENRNSQIARVHYLRGFALSESRQLNDALLAFSEACRLRPDNALYLYNYGVTYWQLGDPAAARSVFLQAIEADDAFAPAFRGAIVLSNQLADSESAIELAARARLFWPDEPLFTEQHGLALALSGQNEQAEQSYSEFEQNPPTTESEQVFFYNQALNYYHMADFTEALRYIEQAKAVSAAESLTIDHYYLLGLINMRLNNLTPAANAFRLALESDNTALSARYALGWIYARQQQLPQAIEQLQLLLQYHPETVAAMELLALIHAQDRNYAMSVEYLQQALRLETDNRQLQKEIAAVWQRAEDFDTALEYMAELQATQGLDGQLRILNIYLLLAAGRYQSAKTEGENLLRQSGILDQNLYRQLRELLAAIDSLPANLVE